MVDYFNLSVFSIMYFTLTHRLPEGFTQLLNLTELYLNDTFLEYLPGSFGRQVDCNVSMVRGLVVVL